MHHLSRVRNGLVRSLGVAAIAAVAAFASGPAYADEVPTFSGSPDGPNSATIGGSQTTTNTSPGTPGSSGSNGSNGSSGGNGGSDAWTNWQGSTTSHPGWSPASTNACDPAQYGPQGYSTTLVLPGPCSQPSPAAPAQPGQPAAPPPPPVITTEMVVDAAKVTAPTNPPHVEPGTVSYVHIPNNYWTETNPVADAVNVLGQTIALTWTPTGTTWSFGDGSTATGDGVQGAGLGAAGAVEHAYARQGSYDITTTTTYNLSFVLPGQGAQTITLTGTPSPAVTLPVREIQTRVSYVR